MSVVRGFGRSSEPLTADEEARFRALAEREPNFGPAAMSWIPGLLATLDALHASPVADTAGIDAAWREAEAALPEGWGIRRLERWPGQDWEVVAVYALGGFVKGNGPTPAAALLALAAALRTPKPEGDR